MIKSAINYIMGIILSIFPFFKNKNTFPKGNYSVAAIKNFKIDVLVDLNTSTAHIDLSMLKNLKISGLESIEFENSVMLSSKKHLGLESGWKDSNNAYKVLVNPDKREFQTMEDYVIELIEKERVKKVQYERNKIKEVILDTSPKTKKVIVPKHNKEIVKSSRSYLDEENVSHLRCDHE